MIWNVPTRPQFNSATIFKPDSIRTPNGCGINFDHQPITMLCHSVDDRVIVEADDFGLLVGFVPEDWGDLRQAIGKIRLWKPGMSVCLSAGRRKGLTHAGGRLDIIESADAHEISITRRPRQPATFVKQAGHNIPDESERAEYEAEERRLATMQKQLTDRLPLASRVHNWKTINRLARLRAECRLAFI